MFHGFTASVIVHLVMCLFGHEAYGWIVNFEKVFERHG